NWALEPISIHLSYSSRISSFLAVVKCPRLEERGGTSKDITDFSPRQYCQITVTRQPDTEGVHSGLGTPPLFRPPLWRSAVVSGLRRCFEQAFGSRRGSGSGTRSNSRGREARHQGRKGKCGAVAR